MHIFSYSSRFKKDLKRTSKSSNFRKKNLEDVLALLAKGNSLDPKHKPHKLSGEFRGCWECHIQPNVLLIYNIDTESSRINLLRVGSHSDLF